MGSLVNVFKIPDLRRKILFTILIIAVYRTGMFLPIPGTHPEYLETLVAEEQAGGADGGFGVGGYLSFIARITGGSFGPFLFSLGIMPYISASIILQLLTQAVPALEKLAKEGESGRRKINEYTRYLTVLLCLIQGYFIAKVGPYGPGEGAGWRGADISPVMYYLACIAAMMAGTIFLMWLGELVDEYGIGNGISLIIMAGIVDRLPAVAQYLSQNATLEFLSFQAGERIGIETVFLVTVMFVGVIIGVVLITQAQRRIPIQQAKHTRGRRTYGGQRQYLPLRVNQAGVIPVIFASSLLYLPMYLFGALVRAVPSDPESSWSWLWPVVQEMHSAFTYGHVMHILAYVTMIFLFCYFWTAIQFQPREIANNLRDWGNFVPGMRPGRRTADYLERVMNRITYVGAAFLSAVAILPIVVSKVTDVSMLMTGFLGGTGLLIIVSVALDIVQRIESHLIMRHYEGFLAEGRVRGRR
ncbi:MAG: preprotein translocase subunit SecY [Planctomycetes bacterium]|nr:preprotein translocase subunit SecY [Planctomycetota bacterium]